MQCFSSTYNIASASAFYLSHPPPQNLKNHKTIRILHVWQSAGLHIRKSAFYRRPYTRPAVCIAVWWTMHTTGLLRQWFTVWVRINHAPARGWTMHRPYWPHRPYTVYMAVLYTKQGAVKLSKILIKSTHSPHRLPQVRISRRTAQTSNTV